MERHIVGLHRTKLDKPANIDMPSPRAKSLAETQTELIRSQLRQPLGEASLRDNIVLGEQ